MPNRAHGNIPNEIPEDIANGAHCRISIMLPWEIFKRNSGGILKKLPERFPERTPAAAINGTTRYIF